MSNRDYLINSENPKMSEAELSGLMNEQNLDSTSNNYDNSIIQ